MRAKLKEEHVGDAEAAVKRMLAAFERESIGGIRYVSVKPQDVVTFLALLEVEDGVDNRSPACGRRTSSTTALPAWYAGPPGCRTGNGDRVLPVLLRRRHRSMRSDSRNTRRRYPRSAATAVGA